jgi:hypothetical protein
MNSSSRFKFSYVVCTFHGIGPLACSEPELTSEAVNPFRYFGGTPCLGDRPVARPVRTQDSTTQKDADIRPCLKRDPNPQSQ